jgi:hypothetical protein
VANVSVALVVAARGRLRVEGECGWASRRRRRTQANDAGSPRREALETPVIHVVFVNLLALVTPADDVVENAGKVYARASWHEGFLVQEDFNKQSLTSIICRRVP